MRSMGHNKQKRKRKEKETIEKNNQEKENKRENKQGLRMAYILRWDWRSFLKV